MKISDAKKLKLIYSSDDTEMKKGTPGVSERSDSGKGTDFDVVTGIQCTFLSGGKINNGK